MLYDMDIEIGHRDCISQVTHVDISEYAPGSPRLEKLYQAMEQQQRFSWPMEISFNV